MSFLRSGYRKSVEKKKKTTKKHINEFYKILHELDIVAHEIFKDHPEDEYDDEFIDEVLGQYTERPIGNMEKNIVLSKLEMLKGFRKEVIEDERENISND